MMIDLELSDKPEVHQIASLLQLDPDAVVGKLVRVWSWFDKQTVDGHAPSVTHALLDRLTARDGFAEAMAQAGWLDAANCGLSMPKFDRWNGQSAKKRALTNRRQAKKRNAAVTQMSRSERDKNVTREEKRRSKNKTIPPNGGSTVWDFGKSLLIEQGLSAQSAGALIGSWLREWTEADVAEALRISAGKADPRAYVAAILKSKVKKGVEQERKVAL